MFRSLASVFALCAVTSVSAKGILLAPDGCAMRMTVSRSVLDKGAEHIHQIKDPQACCAKICAQKGLAWTGKIKSKPKAHYMGGDSFLIEHCVCK